MRIEDSEETLSSWIDKQKVAYIASVDESGFPFLKAMLPPRKREGIYSFWFTTNTSSMRVTHYRTNPKASIYFCDPQRFIGMLFKGTMEVLTDAESKQLIWREGDTLYYPGGVLDPDYCVLKFTAQSGRSYGHFQSDDFDIKGGKSDANS